jgi:Protein of unknown function (DUF1353)
MTGIIRALSALVITAILAGCYPQGGTSHDRERMSASGSIKTQVGKKRPAAPDLVRTKKGRYKLRAPWKVQLNGREWNIQRGYSSNGITAPDSLKKTLGDGVNHPETWAALYHDWLFTQPNITRNEADRLFYELLIAYDVPQTKARLMYSTVAAYSASKAFR